MDWRPLNSVVSAVADPASTATRTESLVNCMMEAVCRSSTLAVKIETVLQPAGLPE